MDRESIEFWNGALKCAIKMERKVPSQLGFSGMISSKGTIYPDVIQERKISSDSSLFCLFISCPMGAFSYIHEWLVKSPFLLSW